MHAITTMYEYQLVPGLSGSDVCVVNTSVCYTLRVHSGGWIDIYGRPLLRVKHLESY